MIKMPEPEPDDYEFEDKEISTPVPKKKGKTSKPGQSIWTSRFWALIVVVKFANLFAICITILPAIVFAVGVVVMINHGSIGYGILMLISMPVVIVLTILIYNRLLDYFLAIEENVRL